jgi:hypothetical protein
MNRAVIVKPVSGAMGACLRGSDLAAGPGAIWWLLQASWPVLVRGQGQGAVKPQDR